MTLYLATNNGLVICERDNGAWRIVSRGMNGRKITAVIAREGVILAGTKEGVFRSDDNGQSWQGASQGLTIPYVRWLAYHPDVSDLEFAGTEPAAIFVSQDGAATWHERPKVAALRDQYEWFLPYSPEAGCVRGFAFHGLRLYAAVEVGGVLRSDDAGESWRLAEGSEGEPHTGYQPEPFVHPDVHSIAVHPSSSDLVYAPTGGGFYTSADGGKTWQYRYDCYCRAVWVDAVDPDHLILGPADGVDRNGRIEVTYNCGRSWQVAAAGLQTPWTGHMVERFSQAGNELLAVLSNGQLLAAPLASLSWQYILPAAGHINAVTSDG